MKEVCPKEDVKLPGGWKWTGEWQIDQDEPGGANGN